MSNQLFAQATLRRLCLAALFGTSAAVHADITVYTSAPDFLSAVSAPGVDTFDDLNTGPLGASLSRNADGWTYQLTSAGGVVGKGGPGDVWLSAGSASGTLTFDQFSAGVYAFGGNFFASALGGGYVPGGNLVLTAADGATLTYQLNGANQYSFVGFISDKALTSVTFGSAAGGAYLPTASAVVLAVPEPAAYGMFLAGLGFVAVMARRRR